MIPRKKRIFVVDDEASTTRLLKLNLELTPEFEVLVENAPRNAVVAAERFKPDLILLDVMMPGLDGGELAARLQANPALKTVPIVFLTAAVKQTEVESLGGKIGGFPFLAKPVDTAALVTALRHHLDQADA